MGKKIQKLLQERVELNGLYNAPEYKWLKYAAFIIIVITIALLVSIIIWMDNLSETSMHIMQGCAGLGAIIFVVLVGILTYRVNSQHIQNRKRLKSPETAHRH